MKDLFSFAKRPAVEKIGDAMSADVLAEQSYFSISFGVAPALPFTTFLKHDLSAYFSGVFLWGGCVTTEPQLKSDIRFS